MKINKKGFTLGELLIVVAIIGVLVAVSIPVFSGKLQSAREARDIANIRNAVAVAQVEYLNEGAVEKGYYFYNVENSFIFNVGKKGNSLINSTYELPVRVKDSGLFKMLFIIVDIDDEDAPVKTYPYVNVNGEIVFKSNKIEDHKGVVYEKISPRRAFRNADKNYFDKK